MTDKLIQDDLDVILDIDEYIEDHNPHQLEHLSEVENVISEFKTLFEKFKACQSELKRALGEDYGEKYPGRNEKRKTFRKYLSVLETRGKELRRDKETREAKERAEERNLELKRLEDAADQRAREADEREKERASEAKERADERAHAISLEQLRLAQKDKSEALDRAELRAQEVEHRAANRSHKDEMLKTKLKQAEEEKARDSDLSQKLEKLKLEQALTLERERIARA